MKLEPSSKFVLRSIWRTVDYAFDDLGYLSFDQDLFLPEYVVFTCF